MQDHGKITNGPSTAVTLSYEKLTERVTTRVLAQRILKQKEFEERIIEREKSLTSNSRSLSDRSQRSSRFLQGTAVPNSTIRSESLGNTPFAEFEDKSVVRARRDASVKEILQRLETRFGVSPDRILKKDDIADKGHNDQQKKQDILTDLQLLESSTRKIETWTTKEKEDVSRGTGVLAPLTGEHHPTYESLKNAVNSKIVPQVIEVNNIESQRLQRTLIQSSLNQDSLQNSSNVRDSILTESQNIELLRKVTSKSSRTSKKSLTLTESSKRLRFQSKRKKSILKRGSRDDSKPLRNVLILENKMEDSETQTYLRMKDFMSDNKMQ